MTDSVKKAEYRRWWASDFGLGACHARNVVSDVASLPHTHGEYALITCLSGSMEFVCSGELHRLEPGEMLMHNPGQVHESRHGKAGSPCDGLTIYFDQAVLEKIFKKMCLPCDTQSHDIAFLGKYYDRKALSLGQELIDELSSHEIGHEVLMESLVMQIPVYLIRNCLVPTFAKLRSKPVHHLPVWEMARAMDYMDICGKKKFHVPDLCTAVGTCKSRFMPLFRNSTGLTPHIYFEQLLVRRSQSLLNAGHPTKAAAYELGFKAVSHFCRIFRRVFGASPGAYRQSQISEGVVPSSGLSKT